MESGRAVVVASTNGVSAVIDRNGDVVATLPRGETATTVSDVQLATTVTPAVRWRDLQQPMILALAAAGLVLSLVRRRYPDRAVRGQSRRSGRPGPIPPPAEQPRSRQAPCSQ
ncbi:hypothetical protein G5V59_19340 [Nocardioides sp. W3-2-3]|nr:hypothetical protein [Nocardioides convexus]